MAKNPTGLIDLVALKQHKVNLNDLMRDETLAAGRRQLAQMLAMWLDSKDERTRNVVEALLIGVFCKRTKWREEDDLVDPTAPTKVEKEADVLLQSAWEAILEGKRPDADKQE